MTSPLRDRKYGLIWSNPNQSDQTLVLNALRGGHLFTIAPAVIYHGMPYVRTAWAYLKATHTLPDGLITYVSEMLDAMEKGLPKDYAGEQQP